MSLRKYLLQNDVFRAYGSTRVDAALSGSSALAVPGIGPVMAKGIFRAVSASGPKALVAAVVPAAPVGRH
jgi:hypothetical protein